MIQADRKDPVGMPMFWKKHESISTKLAAYFDQCDIFFNLFEKAFGMYLDTGHGSAFEAAVNKTHDAESNADDLRRDIELTLYGKALLPDSRGDLLGLLESFDLIPTAGETVLFDLLCQKINIIQEIIQPLRDLVDTNLQCYYLLRKTIDALMNNPRVTLHAVKEVDAKESQSDRQERKLIQQVFSTDLKKGDKLELKNLICQIGRISDLAEHTSDRVGIIAIKRQI